MQIYLYFTTLKWVIFQLFSKNDWTIRGFPQIGQFHHKPHDNYIKVINNLNIHTCLEI